MTTPLIPLWIPLLFVVSSPAQEEVSNVLARARRAIGWEQLEPAGSAIEVRGAARFLGTDAEQTILFDGAGRFFQRFEGELTQRGGFDGETAWVVDWTNTARALELGDRANARVSALLLSGGWAAPWSPLELTLAAEQPPDAIALDFVHADGVLAGELRLDAESDLLTQACFGNGEARGTRWTFSDHREHDGFRFPRKIEIVQQGILQDLVTSSVEHLERVPAERFAADLAPARDVRFDPELPPALEVRRVPSGHLLVHPSIDGKDLGWFMFDSGAGIHCISKHVADQLDDGPFGEILARGVGGSVPAQFWRAASLELGPVTFDHPILMELDLAFLEEPFGVPVGGVLGFELFARCAVELDMREATISLHDPGTYELPAGGRWQEAVLYGRHPCVRASVEGQEGLFKIDTGAADDTVTLHYQAVRDLDLLNGRETRAGASGGVGGQVPIRNGELSSFELGGRSFTPLAASFAVEDKGVFSDAYLWGNIGGELLEPFLLVFDYPNQRLGFVPR